MSKRQSKILSKIRGKLRDAIKRLRKRWPLVRRRTLVARQEEASRAIVGQAKAHKAELDETTRCIAELLPRLIKLDYVFSREPAPGRSRYRLVTEFDERMIQECFVWGNDKRLIEFMAHHTARQVERELHTINFRRFRELDEPRRYSPADYIVPQ